MDFPKFIAMLENAGLFFVRSDKLEDSFEGSYAQLNEPLKYEVYRWRENGLSEEQLKMLFGKQRESMRHFRQWVMINSWHMNENESEAMWKLYAQANASICIQSSYDLLRASLRQANNNIFIGLVEYIDYEKEWMSERFFLYRFTYKRKCFEHENELRCLLWYVPRADSGEIDLEIPPPKFGIWEKVNLDVLIKGLYVAPKSPEWFQELVDKVLMRYGLKKRVTKSALEEKPFF
jgi:hypothetical protein